MTTANRTRNAYIAFVVIALIGVLGVAIYGESREADAIEWGRHTQQVLIATDRVRGRVSGTEAVAREYILTGDTSLAVRAITGIADIHATVAALRSLVADNADQLGRVDTLASTLAARNDRLVVTVAVRRTMGIEAAVRHIQEGADRGLVDSAKRILDAMQAEEERLLVEHSAHAIRSSLFSFTAQVIAGLLIAIFGALTLRELNRRARESAVADAMRIEAASQFKTLTESMPDAVFIQQDDAIAFANDAAARLLGVASPDALRGRWLHDVLRPDVHAEAARQQARARLATGEFISGEEVFVRADGTEVHVGVVAAPTTFNGRPALHVVARDLSERRRTERALALLRQRNELIVNSVTDGLHGLGPDGTIDFENAAAERMFGCAPGELLGKPAHTAVHHHHADGTEYPVEECPIYATLRDGETRTVRNDLFWRRDGTSFPVEYAVSAVTDGSGNRAGAVVSFRDISERLRVEAELDRFFSLSLDMLCIANADGYFKRVSPAFTKTLGWSAEEMVTRPYVDFVHPDDLAATLREVERQVVAGENVLQFENRYRHKDGSWRVLSWKSTPQPDGFMYAVARDVTAAKESELALRKAHEALALANHDLAHVSRLKDEFLANMSHELRTPLNAILGLSETLLEQLADTLTPRQARSLATISTSGQHLLELINDILDLSKVEAGKLELYADGLNVQEFCESCMAFVRTQAMHKQIAVAFEHDGRVTAFQADPKRFKQVLVNLLTNAVKFTPEGGRIGLTVAADGEDALRFTVWDTGIGIAPDDQAKLFTAFTQIDSGLSRSEEGTGLGLALVSRLVELHGGSVSLESTPGTGSRFSVTIPVGSPLTVGLDEPSPMAGTAVRSAYRRVLIIEDDPTAGDQLTRYLTELGLSTVVLPSGDEVKDAVVRERPDFILLDIILPSESGWVVLARLKEHPQTRDVPVVVVSVVDEPQKSLILGAAAHLTKPVTRAQLAAFLQHAPVQHAARPARAGHLARAPRGTGPLILLAEDNEANVLTIGGYFEDAGYAMQYAANGLAAVRRARELHPALILMDIQMPVMDGLTAIREIRQDGALADIPIIALTALAMPGDRERCLAAGATDYMSKPANLKALAALVERLVPHA